MLEINHFLKEGVQWVFTNGRLDHLFPHKGFATLDDYRKALAISRARLPEGALTAQELTFPEEFSAAILRILEKRLLKTPAVLTENGFIDLSLLRQVKAFDQTVRGPVEDIKLEKLGVQGLYGACRATFKQSEAELQFSQAGQLVWGREGYEAFPVDGILVRNAVKGDLRAHPFVTTTRTPVIPTSHLVDAAIVDFALSRTPRSEHLPEFCPKKLPIATEQCQ